MTKQDILFVYLRGLDRSTGVFYSWDTGPKRGVRVTRTEQAHCLQFEHGGTKHKNQMATGQIENTR